MNYLNKLIVTGAIVASLGLGACTDSPEPAGNGINGNLEIPAMGSMEFDNAEASVNSGLNDFAFNFLNRSAAVMESTNTNDGNIVVFPLSASLALSLVANSCDDEATQAISEMLGIDNTENLNLTVNKLMRFLSATGEGETLDLANSVWYDAALAADEAWKNALRSDLYSATSPLDFSSDTAVDVINNWCSMNTNGMIRDFIKYIDPMTRVCFLNAMYYVGKWEDPFSKKTRILPHLKARTEIQKSI